MPIMTSDRLLETIRLLSQQHSHDSVKCPMCNTEHPFQSYPYPEEDSNAATNTEDDLFGPVYLSNPQASCSRCQSSTTLFRLSNGHLTCKDCSSRPCTTKTTSTFLCQDVTQATPPATAAAMDDLCSHGARAIALWPGFGEHCPVCLDTFTDRMIALPCGHLVCGRDFEQLGGLRGPPALLSLEQVHDWRQERLKELRNEYSNSMTRLIASLAEDEDRNKVEVSLSLLKVVTNCGQGDAPTFVRLGGIRATQLAFTRFANSQKIQELCIWLLNSVVCPHHCEEEEVNKRAQEILCTGFVPLFYTRLNRDDTSTSVSTALCMLMTHVFQSDAGAPYFQSNVEEFRETARSLLGVLAQSDDTASLQRAGMVALRALFHGSAGVYSSAMFREFVVGLKGLETVAQLFRVNPRDSFIAYQMMGLFFHLLKGGQKMEGILSMGGLELTSTALDHHLDVADIQEDGILLLTDMTKQSLMELQAVQIGQALVKHNAVGLVRKAMLEWCENPCVLEAGCDFFHVFLQHSEAALEASCLEIVRQDGIQALVQCLACERGQEHPYLYDKTIRLLLRLSRSQETEVLEGLSTSEVIPSLKKLGMRLPDCRMAWRPEKMGIMCVLGALGIIDVEYEDGKSVFEGLDGFKVRSPPFDVESILAADLTTPSAPGWYKFQPFTVDRDRSSALFNQASDPAESFLGLHLPPEKNQRVCLRVILPFGGRGYLQGRVSQVSPAPAPTVEEPASSSGSSSGSSFGRSCPCPNMAGVFCEGTRHSMVLGNDAALPSQKVTAIVKLEPMPIDDVSRLRFGPLLAFFRDASYEVRLGWDAAERQWRATRISAV